jgi:hypothetical protein
MTGRILIANRVIKGKQIKVLKSQAEIDSGVLNHFRFHIGEDEKTTREEVFQQVLGISPYAIDDKNKPLFDMFKREYWFEKLAESIRRLRRTDRAFIVKKNGKYFVLKTQEEADGYKGVCDSTINKIGRAKDRADSWVKEQKWKKLQSQKSNKD